MAIVTYDQADIIYDEPTIAYGGRLANSLFIAINNIDINIGNFHISTIFHDHISPLILENDIVARKDGTKLLAKNLSPKFIPITGRIQDDTNTLEENIDTFKQSVNVSTGILDISYAGINRRYVVALQSLVIDRDYFNIKFADYSMEFVVLSAVGKDTDVTETLSVDDLTETTTSWEDISFEGSAEPRPLIQYLIDTAGNLREIQFNQNDTETQMIVGTAWSDGDVLNIDTDNRTVQINGSDIEFEGVFPRFVIGDNDFTSSFTKDTIEAQQTQSNSSEFSFGQSGEIMAESFVASGNINIGSLQLLIARGPNTIQNLNINIETDAAGLPSGTPVANAEIDLTPADVNTSLSWTNAIFATPPALTSGNTYWITLQCDSAGGFEDFYQWGINRSGGFDGGVAKLFRQEFWADISGDFAFKIFEDAVATYEISKKITYTRRFL